MNGTESPDITEEEIEEVAERSVNLIGKKILKWVGILTGFAVTGLALAKVLEPKGEVIFIVEPCEVAEPENDETPEVVDPSEEPTN